MRRRQHINNIGMWMSQLSKLKLWAMYIKHLDCFIRIAMPEVYKCCIVCRPGLCGETICWEILIEFFEIEVVSCTHFLPNSGWTENICNHHRVPISCENGKSVFEVFLFVCERSPHRMITKVNIEHFTHIRRNSCKCVYDDAVCRKRVDDKWW